MAKKKKKTPLHHQIKKHAKRIVVVTPKFVHGVFVGAVVGALLVLVLRAVSPAAAATASTQDCSANSIMHCGATTKTQFINKVKANTEGDLKNIYAQFQLPTNYYYTKFINKAVSGQDMRDGRIVVNGKTIATNSYSLGRDRMGVPLKNKVVIKGKTYWKGTPTQRFSARENSIPVWVLYKDDGSIRFVVMKACGNPVGGTQKSTPKPTPTPSPTPPSPTPPPPTPEPTPPPTEVTPAAAKALPNTGPGAILIIALVAIIGGYVFHMTHQRKLRKHHAAVHHHSSARKHHRRK